MVIRFRYTTPDGAVVELYDLDGLMRHVVDGHVTADTELYDALTQVTAPAREQAAYQLVEDLIPEHDRERTASVQDDADLDGSVEVDDEESKESEAVDDRRSEESEGDDLAVPGLQVTLAEVEAPESTEEVIRQMEKDRARDGFDDTVQIDSARIDPFNETLRSWDDQGGSRESERRDAERGDARPDRDGPSDRARPEELVGHDAGPEAAETSRDRPEAKSSVSREGGSPEITGETEAQLDVQRAWGAKSRREPSSIPDLQIPLWVLERFTRAGGSELARLRRRALEREHAVNASVVRSPFLAALAATMLVATVSIGMGESKTVPTRTRVLDTAPPPLDLVGVADRLAASGGIALEHMVEAMDSVAETYNVKDVPRAWLEIHYFTNVNLYPEVRAHWVRYKEFIDQLRREEEALFRQGYVQRLQELGVSSSVMSMRLAQAVRVFEAGAAERDSVYANMERLADRSIALHDLLFDQRASIRMDPAADVGAANDPFLQLVTDEPELREEVLEHIDAILETVEAINGEARWTRDRLNSGILSSLRATGARGNSVPPSS